jgi:hypothetical protein
MVLFLVIEEVLLSNLVGTAGTFSVGKVARVELVT